MRLFLLTLVSGILFSSTLMADFTRVEMGAGAWMSTPKGEVSYTDGLTANDVSTQKETANPYVWIYIKHPLPVLPNIRLEYTQTSTKGLASGAFKDFTAATGTPTELDLRQFDIIPYYNILDNTAWITLDLGLDIKVLDASYTAESVTVPGIGITNYTKTSTLAIPLVYVRTRFEIPATDIALEADAKFIKYSSSTIYDARVKLDYTLSIFPVIEPAIEVGYRIQKYDVNEEDLNGKTNLEFSGFYVGAMIRF